MLAVDVSSWLRPDAATSLERRFCHVYGRGKDQAQMMYGWPYSVVAALGHAGSYPARAGGPWLCRTLVLFLFHALVVPSGLTTRVQPHR